MKREVGLRNLRVYLVLGGSFLTLTGMLMVVSVSLDIRRAEQRFSEQANLTQSRFEAMASRNQIALQGFAAMLKIVDPDDFQAQSQYAREVLRTQSHLYMLEIVQQATAERLLEMSRSLAVRGITGFTPQRVEAGRLVPAPAQAAYYLLTFMEPLTPENRHVLGFDFESMDATRDVLHRAMVTETAVASAPLRVFDGEMAYLLMQSVRRNDRQIFAVVICRAKDMMPAELAADGRLGLQVIYEGPGGTAENKLISQPVSIEPGPLARRFLPRLRAQHPVDGPEQPFRLVIEKQLDWDIIQLPMVGLIAVGGAAALLVLVEYARAHHRHEMKRLEESDKLFVLANFDNLTGLPNRQLFKNRLEQALAVAHRQGTLLAVLFLDLDGFKGINDYYGHQTGDRVLRRAAGIFQRCVREIDTVARLGGDEFVILLQNIDGRGKAEQVAQKIKKAFMKHGGEAKALPIIGVSVGVAIYPEDGVSAVDLIREADVHMYRDKSERKSPPVA
ncbi:sensor domain-containing diguanylate cyclase [Methylococcus sp. EFPC2]|uniref:sensor domain-containing diguanylate cyclase n=1 Tax=Methylococcus sp. EFPC2 TaxID=2812648 RepID=UPI00196870DD|nr:sensor domain-containing diguanylate cyclase [Methylococcus sp. EFPC2]QSA95571.1 sensor domain-containing diguanylate cyclase [Methylococcus sp. EFPC2]